MPACPEPELPDGHALVAALAQATLPRDRWDHGAHLTAARRLYRDLGTAGGALGELRGLITAYNARTGVPAHRVICHETITRYFFGTVAALDALPFEALLAHPWCARTAPLRHWSPERLRGRVAARSWVAPDRAPLPKVVAMHADPDHDHDQTGAPR